MRSGAAKTAAVRTQPSQGSSYSSTGRTAVSRYSSENYGYAKPELVVNNYNIVNVYNNTTVINRNYLIDYGGRWGYCHDYYSGRNYHFYMTLVNQNYFGFGLRVWDRRYYGDGWDFHFGWSPNRYFVSGWYNRGSYYFEPCYAFSFTFNHGYEQGYIDGYRQGVTDWNYNYYYRGWVGTSNGYQGYWGSWDEYTDGYEQGFRQGYYAGYCGLAFGYYNYGFGDFSNYPVVYDYDYDYYDTNEVAYYDDDDYYEDDYYDYNY